jgi:hypothetical protein
MCGGRFGGKVEKQREKKIEEQKYRQYRLSILFLKITKLLQF